jgi:hypothetical protein
MGGSDETRSWRREPLSVWWLLFTFFGPGSVCVVIAFGIRDAANTPRGMSSAFYVWLVLAGGFCFACYRLTLYPTLVAGPSGLVVKNPFLTYRIGWSDVTDVVVERKVKGGTSKETGLSILAIRGQRVRVQALYVARDRYGTLGDPDRPVAVRCRLSEMRDTFRNRQQRLLADRATGKVDAPRDDVTSTPVVDRRRTSRDAVPSSDVTMSVADWAPDAVPAGTLRASRDPRRALLLWLLVPCVFFIGMAVLVVLITVRVGPDNSVDCGTPLRAAAHLNAAARAQCRSSGIDGNILTTELLAFVGLALLASSVLVATGRRGASQASPGLDRSETPPRSAVVARRWGVASLVVVPVVGAVVAILLGSQARHEIVQSGGSPRGERVASMGVLLGTFGLLLPTVAVMTAGVVAFRTY